ncbi:MAG: heat-inducible transcriptional repressor HrcA [Bacilli bacterium]|nr:heat-inducible transcriptional repressor HrcA [Bacilli bacterium]MDD4795059.1 heat-inducible transcriptional repressor HrcA [Bacilli bacterium]
MNNRQNNLLKIIIETYIKTVKPVGSKSLVKKLKCSSATIRNDMAYLETLGYLEKTHLSSGRIPSEDGYKYYVDNLMKPKEITGDDVLKLQTILNNKELVVSDAILKCMEIISEITNYTSIVLGKDSKDQTLKQVNIVPIDDKKVVAVVITSTGHVENKQTNITDAINVTEIVKACEIINKHLVGTPLSDINAKLEYEIKPIIATKIKQYEEVMCFFQDAFNDFSVKQSDVFFSGKTNILKQPEYNEPDKIKAIISKLENTELVKKIETDEEGINVYIGEESKFDEDVTIIKTSYKLGSEEGTLAIIGPKRMEYDKVVYLLQFLKNYLER